MAKKKSTKKAAKKTASTAGLKANGKLKKGCRYAKGGRVVCKAKKR